MHHRLLLLVSLFTVSLGGQQAPGTRSQVLDSLRGAITLTASETGVVVACDQAGPAGIGDGVVDRVFTVQRAGGSPLRLTGLGVVRHAPARLVIELEAQPRPLVYRVADQDTEGGVPPGADVESVIGIASWVPPAGTVMGARDLDVASLVPLRPPKCEECWSGGSGSTSCSVSCDGTSCQVTCGQGYSACCNCVGVARCVCCM